jgi:hypothetical protein
LFVFENMELRKILVGVSNPSPYSLRWGQETTHASHRGTAPWLVSGTGFLRGEGEEVKEVKSQGPEVAPKPGPVGAASSFSSNIC